ncbi:hypothetical protein J4227_06955 [Candidatus Woesearchaeota archaeon]|nr:hypothetical protein [Candidatus Woesearchaeota archaeon]
MATNAVQRRALHMRAAKLFRIYDVLRAEKAKLNSIAARLLPHAEELANSVDTGDIASRLTFLNVSAVELELLTNAIQHEIAFWKIVKADIDALVQDRKQFSGLSGSGAEANAGILRTVMLNIDKLHKMLNASFNKPRNNLLAILEKQLIAAERHRWQDYQEYYRREQNLFRDFTLMRDDVEKLKGILPDYAVKLSRQAMAKRAGMITGVMVVVLLANSIIGGYFSNKGIFPGDDKGQVVQVIQGGERIHIPNNLDIDNQATLVEIGAIMSGVKFDYDFKGIKAVGDRDIEIDKGYFGDYEYKTAHASAIDSAHIPALIRKIGSAKLMGTEVDWLGSKFKGIMGTYQDETLRIWHDGWRSYFVETWKGGKKASFLEIFVIGGKVGIVKLLKNDGSGYYVIRGTTARALEHNGGGMYRERDQGLGSKWKSPFIQGIDTDSNGSDIISQAEHIVSICSNLLK